MIKLNFDEADRLKGKFEQCTDMIPLLIMNFDVHKYYTNLKKKGVYDEVQERIVERRMKIQFMGSEEYLDFEVKELLEFIEKYPEFKSIIIED